MFNSEGYSFAVMLERNTVIKFTQVSIDRLVHHMKILMPTGCKGGDPTAFFAHCYNAGPATP
jgi:hypothetical protein